MKTPENVDMDDKFIKDVSERNTFFESITFTTDPDLNCESQILKDILAAWNAARGDRRMPARRDIDPVDLPAVLLPHLLLIDVEHEPARRFRWRLIGTAITARLGRDMTGQYWNDIYEPEVEAALATGPLWAIENRAPVRTVGIAPIEEKRHLISENLDMPLSDDGVTVNMILAASAY